jgi:hypothetical protein
MKRFSKIVSVMTLSPRARHMSTRNCACMSVGKAGVRRGRHVDGAKRPGAAHADVLAFARDLDPRGAHLDDERLEVGELGPSSETSPPSAIAAATMYVPASMRSG